MNDVTLKQTQEWMMTLLAVRGDLRQKVMSAAAHTQLPLDAFAAGEALPAFYRRLHVYTSGYVMRLVECLKSEYPSLERFMGELVFADFAKAYIVTLPSSNPSLYELGAGFSAFLDETRPRGSLTVEESAYFCVPAEIARIERAKVEVSLAKGFEVVFNDHAFDAGIFHNHDSQKGMFQVRAFQNSAFEEPKNVSDFALFQPDFRVEIPPCLRLLSLAYRTFSLMDKVDSGIEYEMPLAEPNFLALSRVHYQLCALELELWQFEFLTLCQVGKTFLECVEQVSNKTGLEQGDILARLMFWLPTAESKGLLKVMSS